MNTVISGPCVSYQLSVYFPFSNWYVITNSWETRKFSSRIHRSFQHVTLTKPELLMLHSKLPTVRAHISTTVLQPRPSTTCSFLLQPPWSLPASDFPEDLPQDLFATGLSLLSPSCEIPSLTLNSVAVFLSSTTHFHLVHSGSVLSNNHTLGIPNVKIIFLGISF